MFQNKDLTPSFLTPHLSLIFLPVSRKIYLEYYVFDPSFYLLYLTFNL